MCLLLLLLLRSLIQKRELVSRWNSTLFTIADILAFVSGRARTRYNSRSRGYEFESYGCSLTIFLNMDRHRPLFRLFLVVLKQTSIQFLQQINVKTMSSSVQCWIRTQNLQIASLSHTTRPGLTILYYLWYLLHSLKIIPSFKKTKIKKKPGFFMKKQLVLLHY